MAEMRDNKSFTGRHMAAVLIIGFGIVAAVNFYMASLATGGFHGTVVDNSYVASQKFNTWIEEAEATRALGWETAMERDGDGYLVVSTKDVPQFATLTAELRRPIGTREYASLTFTPIDETRYRSSEPIAPGRWTVRMFIQAGERKWAKESEL